MEEQLSRLIEKAIEVAEKTGEFVIDQAPMLLQEFYAWHTAMAIAEMCILPIFIIVMYVVYKVAPKEEDHIDMMELFGKETNDTYAIIVYATGTITAIFVATAFVDGLLTLIKIQVAPKLYLIDYFIK